MMPIKRDVEAFALLCPEIYDQADGSVFFTEDPAREEYTQCCQIDGNRRKSKRDRNKGADRHEGGEDPA